MVVDKIRFSDEFLLDKFIVGFLGPKCLLLQKYHSGRMLEEINVCKWSKIRQNKEAKT